MASKSRAGLLKKLKGAKEGGVGNNFRDGRYRLVVRQLQLLRGFKGQRFQATLVPMTATKIPVQSVKTGEKLDIEPNPIGSDVDWLCTKLDEDDSVGPGNLRKFIRSLCTSLKEISDDDFAETLAEVCDLCMGTDAAQCVCEDKAEHGAPTKVALEPAKGMMIDMETVRIETSKNKKEIVVCNWTHVEQTEEERQENIKWLAALTTAQAAMKKAATAEARA